MTTTASDNEFPEGQSSIHAYGTVWELITPHDTNKIRLYKAILCGGTGGTIACVDAAGTAGAFVISSGQLLQGVRPTIIKSTGTAATPLYGIVR